MIYGIYDMDSFGKNVQLLIDSVHPCGDENNPEFYLEMNFPLVADLSTFAKKQKANADFNACRGDLLESIRCSALPFAEDRSELYRFWVWMLKTFAEAPTSYYAYYAALMTFPLLEDLLKDHLRSKNEKT